MFFQYKKNNHFEINNIIIDFNRVDTTFIEKFNTFD